MVTFRASLENAHQRIEARKNAGCPSASEQAGMILGQIFTQMAAVGIYSLATSTPAEKTPKNNPTTDNAVDETGTPLGKTGNDETPDQTILTPEQKKAKVVDLIKQHRTDFDGTNEYINDLVSKYDLYTTFHSDWDENQIADRLNMYLKALEAHTTELKYGEISQQQGLEAIEGMKKYNIVDDDIVTANEGSVTPEYIDAMLARGTGYLDLYDSDGDGTISFAEFIALEAKDAGRILTPDEIAETGNYFRMMNKDNPNETDINKIFIDAKEMASHRYAMSRLYDFDSFANKKGNTENDITFAEWYGAQSQHKNVRQQLSGIADSLYKELKDK